MRGLLPVLRNERGQAVILGAVALLAAIAVAGLAVDAGRYFVVRAQLAKAVDGGALAGARVLPTGQESAETAALEVAEMNFAPGFMNTTSHAFVATFDPDPSRARVAVRGNAELPTTLLRVVGIRTSTVTAFAEAERRPLSVAFVLDNSFSLDPSFAGVDAIGYLRDASETFVSYFDDTMDRMSLSLFSTGTVLPFALAHDFRAPMTASVRAMEAISHTNLADGLASGHRQLAADPDPSAFRALVFFTDGRPTAIRGRFPSTAGILDAVLIGDQEPGGSVDRDLYEADRLHARIPGATFTGTQLPDGSPVTVPDLQALASRDVRAAAAAARSGGITVYTIGLGNPHNPQAWKQPDAALLLEMANVPFGTDPQTGNTLVNAAYDRTQPEGGFYFVPDATELEAVFERVAQEIVLRLTQ
jgi:Flp pilus assembly protein TadG